MHTLQCYIPNLGSNIKANQFLASLPAADLDRLRPHLQIVQLQHKEVLCDLGVTPAYVYFPTTAIISLLHISAAGETSETAVVGNDGVVDLSLFMGGNTAPHQTIVQSQGQAFRLRGNIAREEFNRGGALIGLLLHYTQALISQMAETVGDLRHRSLQQRVCRRLQQNLDRLNTDEIEMTHEMMAALLGVRRETVSAAAFKLQSAGVIRYSRGHIAVLDRQRLAYLACHDSDLPATEMRQSMQLSAA